LSSIKAADIQIHSNSLAIIILLEGNSLDSSLVSFEMRLKTKIIILLYFKIFLIGKMSHLSEKEVYAKTVYGEARGEPEEGQKWVAWVIKNRASKNRGYWGGGSIKGVCLHKNQFECWKDKDDIAINEKGVYDKIQKLTEGIYNAPLGNDPTGGSDHFNNPDKEGCPSWTENCTKTKKIGGHQFYKGN
jgi:N-acetylmuramoyl-L-alanine amidase